MMKPNAKEEKLYEMHFEFLQPWSTFVMKTQLPPEILQKMLKITDEIVANAETAKSWGHNLAGQIKDELVLDLEILEQEDLTAFFLDMTRQFVIQQTLQKNPMVKEAILNDEWYTKILDMWIISQKDNEYNPIHTHTNCHISTVMYLKIPEYLPSRKSRQVVLKSQNNTTSYSIGEDGAICFVNNAVRDQIWATATMTILPAVGDFYIFPASQGHTVYPFRTPDGKGERRSVSFNATFTSKEEQEEIRKQQEKPEAI